MYCQLTNEIEGCWDVSKNVLGWRVKQLYLQADTRGQDRATGRRAGEVENVSDSLSLKEAHVLRVGLRPDDHEIQDVARCWVQKEVRIWVRSGATRDRPWGQLGGGADQELGTLAF